MYSNVGGSKFRKQQPLGSRNNPVHHPYYFAIHLYLSTPLLLIENPTDTTYSNKHTYNIYYHFIYTVVATGSLSLCRRADSPKILGLPSDTSRPQASPGTVAVLGGLGSMDDYGCMDVPKAPKSPSSRIYHRWMFLDDETLEVYQDQYHLMEVANDLLEHLSLQSLCLRLCFRCCIVKITGRLAPRAGNTRLPKGSLQQRLSCRRQCPCVMRGRKLCMLLTCFTLGQYRKTKQSRSSSAQGGA